MSWTDLQTALQNQADGNNNKITISASVLQAASLTPRDNFDELIKSFLLLTGDLTVTVQGKIPAPTTNSLTISNGQASFLGLTNATLQTLEFVENSGVVDLRVAVSLGDDYSLKNGFSGLDGFPFGEFTLDNAYYVFTTEPQGTYQWNSETVSLTQGLNFASVLSAALGQNNALGILELILENVDQNLKLDLTGTINPANQDPSTGKLPDVSMTAGIDSVVKAIPSYFPLTNPRIGLEANQGTDGTQYLWLTFLATLSIEKQTLGDIKAVISPKSDIFSLSLVPPNSGLISVETVIQLIGGEDVTKLIPPDLQSAFNSFGLTGLSVGLDVKQFEITHIGASIGSNTWTMGQFTIEELALRYTILDPFGSNKDSSFVFEAKSKIFPDIFKGEFDVEIDYDVTSSDLSVAANFTGSVHLSDLIKGLSGGDIVIPPSFPDFELDDFGMTFAKQDANTYNYTLYATAKITVDLEILGSKLTATFSANVDSSKKSYTATGSLLIGDSYFQAEIDFSANDKILTASWTALNDRYLEITDIIKDLGFDPPDIPTDLDLGLESAKFTYDLTNKIVIIEADSANYGEAVFVGFNNPTGSPPVSKWQFFFGLNVGKTINLTNLPLINSILSEADTVDLEQIHIIISSDAIPQTDTDLIQKINNLIGSDYPQIPTAGVGAGFGFSMVLNVGGHQLPFALMPKSSQQQNNQVTSLAAVQTKTALGDSGSDSSSIVWFNVQKTFGPISFQKVGIQYKDGVLYFLMNVSISGGGLTIALMGLGVGSPLKSFEPHFTIQGLAIVFQEGPVEISGGLIGSLDPINFYGELILGFPQLTIAALGGYAVVENHPSFFLYAVLDYPIGGPSFFFITGLSAGFGFNRKLLIPDVSGVATFPLVQWAVNGGPGMNTGGDIGQQVTQVLTTLSTSGVVAPSVGDYWLALGIRFTSFELVDSFALLTIIFGTKFEIALLGFSRISLPPAEPVPVAYAELELEATFSPSDGLLAIQGQLTPQSYVLSKDCHLSGGFAFYSWFAGDYEGDFVITLGGYSPRFTPPPYYPQVPRLALNWQVTSDLTIKGDLYFALTSNAIMAGGGMSAVWSSGDISAWFDVEADFLMVFTPFHYYISASIHLGASFTIDLLFTSITITIHIGVGLQIWGPEFAGEADIDLSIISFTIHFGASDQNNQTTIEWSDFVDQLLPKTGQQKSSVSAKSSRRTMLRTATFAADDSPPPSIVQINISNGLLKKLSDKLGELNYVVSAELCEITTVTAIPLKDFTFSSNILKPDEGNRNSDFGVGPTGTDSNDFSSTHNITITSAEDSEFQAFYVIKNVSKSLWEKKDFDGNGVPQNVDPLNNTTIANTSTGIRLVPYVPPPDHTLPIKIVDLQYTIDTPLQTFAWSVPAYPTTDSFSTETVSGTIDDASAQANRPQLLAAMQNAGFLTFNTSQIDVADLANQSTNYLVAAPDLSLLGEQKNTSGEE